MDGMVYDLVYFKGGHIWITIYICTVYLYLFLGVFWFIVASVAILSVLKPKKKKTWNKKCVLYQLKITLLNVRVPWNKGEIALAAYDVLWLWILCLLYRFNWVRSVQHCKIWDQMRWDECFWTHSNVCIQIQWNTTPSPSPSSSFKNWILLFRNVDPFQ